MSTQTPETSIARSAGDIRAWMIDELSRILQVNPSVIDTAAALYSLGVDSLGAIGMTGKMAE